MRTSEANWAKSVSIKAKSRTNSASNNKQGSELKLAQAKSSAGNKEEVKIDIVKKPKPRVYSHINQIRKMESLLPPVDRSKVIIKKFGTIEAFAVNTHVGTVREYNEDRVSILLNAQQR
jgi:hypothetical protein